MPWVSIVLTTFWTRLLYLDDPATLDAKLGHAAKEASDELSAIAMRYAVIDGRSSRSPRRRRARTRSSQLLERLRQRLSRREHAGVQVAVLAHALEHDGHRVDRRVELVVHLVPARAASRPARSAAAAPSRRTRSSSLRRSGSSRSARRGASPSTTRSSRASDACARSRRRRARRSERVSSNVDAPVDRHEHVEALAAATSSGTTRSSSASSSSLRISATSTVCDHGTSGVGSRSKSTKSGRSGLSIREYHVFMSMQPMLTIQSSASSSLTSGNSTHFLRARFLARRDERAEARDPLGHVLRRVLLEERLAVRAVGIAAHRERPVLQVRDEHVGNRLVVAAAGRPS